MFMRVVIVDDESGARASLRRLIENEFPSVEVVGEAEGVNSAKKLIDEVNPELAFLDVQMQDGTGFDLLKLIDLSNIQVVFVSAYDHFAITAIKFSAVDYLLKPVEKQDLESTLERIEKHKSDSELKKKIDLLLNNVNRIDKIALPSLSGIEFVKLSDIVRCESDNNYTNFFLLDGGKIVVSKTLKEFEDMLESKGFFRTHKSHIINLNYLKKYIKGEGGSVIMEDGSEVLVSRRRKEDFMNVLAGM